MAQVNFDGLIGGTVSRIVTGETGLKHIERGTIVGWAYNPDMGDVEVIAYCGAWDRLRSISLIWEPDIGGEFDLSLHKQEG